MFKSTNKIFRSWREAKDKFQNIFVKNKSLPLREADFIECDEDYNPCNDGIQLQFVPQDSSTDIEHILTTTLQDKRDKMSSQGQLSPSPRSKFRCDECRDKDERQSLSANISNERKLGRGESTEIRGKMESKDTIETYKNNSTPRGLVFMQNFEHFDEPSFPHRKGSNLDYKNLMCLFNQIGYKCDEANGYCRSGRITGYECLSNLKRFSSLSDHDDLDSCLVVIMSHGSGDKTFIGSDGKEIRVKDICKILNNVHCKPLRGKPKVCIFQFCRKSTWKSSDEESDLSECEGINKPSTKPPAAKQRRRSRKESLSFMSFTGSTNSLNCPSQPGRHMSLISNSSVFTDSGYEEATTNCTNQLTVPYEYYDELTWNQNKSGGYRGECEEFKTEDDMTDTKEPVQVIYDADSSSVSVPTHDIQINSDFFLVFSTIAGEVSYRDPRSGSILIQAVCHVFGRNVHSDNIDSLFKKVSLYMKNETLRGSHENYIPQTCERINIGFDKDFYFNPEDAINAPAKLSDRRRDYFPPYFY